MGKKLLVCLLAITFSVLMAQVCLAKSAFLVKEGMRGAQVREVQELLISKGFLQGEADGVCGAATVAAIKKFQEQAGLEPDGICGDETYAMLGGHMSGGSNFSAEAASGALKPGMKGDRVRAMQELLLKHGYLLAQPDGSYGSRTEEAVRKFQQDVGLEVDGICGAETLSRLENRDSSAGNAHEHSAYAATGTVLKPGMHGDGVTLVQQYLIDLGYLNDAADGLYGPKTVAAVKRFQADNGLVADGICGSATYAALQVSPKTTEAAAPPQTTTAPEGGRVVYVEASAYSPMDPGMNLHTATGKFLRRGIIAVDPSFIPLGTRVFIPGYGDATADDIGYAIKGNRIDIAFDTHEEALLFGRRSLEIYIYD